MVKRKQENCERKELLSSMASQKDQSAVSGSFEVDDDNLFPDEQIENKQEDQNVRRVFVDDLDKGNSQKEFKQIDPKDA